MDTEKFKIGHEYDAIRKDLLICHQNRAWQVIQYSITIQSVFIAGWFYVMFEAFQPILAVGATLFSFIIMFLLKQALQRYNFLMNQASSALNREEHIYFKSEKSSAPGGHVTNTRIMDTILFFNAIMFGFTLCKILPS